MANRHVTTVSSEPRAQVSNTVRVSPAFVFLGRCCRGTQGCCDFFPRCSVLFFQVGFIPLHEYNRLQAGLQAAGDQPHIVFATVAARKRLAGTRSHAPVRVIVNLPCPPLLEGAVRAAIGRRIDTGNNTTGPPAVATTRARAPPNRATLFPIHSLSSRPCPAAQTPPVPWRCAPTRVHHLRTEGGGCCLLSLPCFTPREDVRPPTLWRLGPSSSVCGRRSSGHQHGPQRRHRHRHWSIDG